MVPFQEQFAQLNSLTQQLFLNLSSVRIEYFIVIGALILIVILIVMLVKETFVIINLMKKLFINSIIGFIAWGVLYYYLKIELPFFASLIISIIFGFPGIGTLLILKFLGII